MKASTSPISIRKNEIGRPKTQSRSPLYKSHPEPRKVLKHRNKQKGLRSRSCSDFAGSSLPYYNNASQPEFNCVSASTLASLLDNKYLSYSYVILDCRFKYEYAGGHVKGAINLDIQEKVKQFFEENRDNQKKTVIIFHCEFSSQRGPNSLRFFRELDRVANWQRWPELYFPELYLLEGGYSNFFKEKPAYCEPQGYISMFDKNYLNECKQSLRRRKTLPRSSSASTERELMVNANDTTPMDCEGDNSSRPLETLQFSPGTLIPRTLSLPDSSLPWGYGYDTTFPQLFPCPRQESCYTGGQVFH